MGVLFSGCIQDESLPGLQPGVLLSHSPALPRQEVLHRARATRKARLLAERPWQAARLPLC